MPAENAAKDNDLDPKIWTNSNISTENQLKKLGLSIDWDREISTCSEVLKHQQIFLNFSKKNWFIGKKIM